MNRSSLSHGSCVAGAVALTVLLACCLACGGHRNESRPQPGRAAVVAGTAAASQPAGEVSPPPPGRGGLPPDRTPATPLTSATPNFGPAVPISHGRTDTNAVALTFDAGADTGYARLILDTLRRNGIRATFGMTGQWAQTNPDLVREMAADGDQLINHTWDHRSLTGLSTKTAALSRADRWSELDRAEQTIRGLTGQTTLPYFRAPFGDQDASVHADAGARGYRYDVLWSVDSGGWAGAPAGRIISTCANGAVPGAIIVMHVGAESQDGPALQAVIDAIRAKGLSFATIGDLVGTP